MNNISKCPVCKNSVFTDFLKTQDYFLSNEKFTIKQCSDCGFKFTNPKPGLNELPKYYASTEYISHSNANKGIVNKIYQKVRAYTLKKKLSLIESYIPEGQILDIGCGTGEFLNTMQERNFVATGIEPNLEARNLAKRNYGLAVYGEEEIVGLKKGHFDVITMWHVLEHVYDLDKRIAQIDNLIADNGILIVAVPNPSSWDAKHYGKYWAAYDCPRHLYHFDQASIKKLFSNSGFELIESKPMYFDSFYVSMLSEKYKQSQLQFLKGMTNGLFSNISAIFNQGNYSSLIYVLKQIKA